MRVTKALVKEFEHWQETAGTAVAIHNLLWLSASLLLKELGCKSVKTTYATRSRKR